MPRKYQNRALLTKPTSSVPSTLVSSRAPAAENHGSSSKPTVNELIRESRGRQGDGLQAFDTSALSSVHPSVRVALNMPALPTRIASTHGSGPARVRRIPGPPPPESWLVESQHAPSRPHRGTLSHLRWLRARLQQQSSTLPGMESLPDVMSLEHIVYTKIATRWQWHAAYDNVFLATLPVSMRMMLLSYLAVHNEEIFPNPFPLLFPGNTEQDELNAVTRLDLTNSLGSWATVKRIEKELVLSREHAFSTKETTQRETSDTVPESWDDVEPDSVSGSIAPSLRLRDELRFLNLKHLSLALNSASSSEKPTWGPLIKLTSHLPGLLSLSLAHWPNPTYTPNAARGRVKIVNTVQRSAPEQVFGGSDMYTRFDGTWREAAGILRSLSRNLYCLQWLDLSGCTRWLAALIWMDENGNNIGADWNGSWRNLSTLVLGVGWLPGRPLTLDEERESLSQSSSSISSTRAIEHLYHGQQGVQDLLEALTAFRLGPIPTGILVTDDPVVNANWDTPSAREKRYFNAEVKKYITLQNSGKGIAEEIKAIRKTGTASKRIEFEFGEELTEESLKDK